MSKIESREDIRVSTLIDYVQALGLDIEITAWGEDGKGGEPIPHVLVRTDRHSKRKQKKGD